MFSWRWFCAYVQILGYMTHLAISKCANLGFLGSLPPTFNASSLELMQMRAAAVSHCDIT